MICEIRDYFDARVKAEDSELDAYQDDVFGNNTLNTTQAEKNYNLIIGPLSITRLDEGWVDAVEVTLDLYSSNGACVYDDYRELYCKAIRVKDDSIDPINVEAASGS